MCKIYNFRINKSLPNENFYESFISLSFLVDKEILYQNDNDHNHKSNGVDKNTELMNNEPYAKEIKIL